MKQTKSETKTKKPKNVPPLFWIKVILLLITDIVCIAGILQINNSMLAASEEIKKLRGVQIGTNTTNPKEVLEGELTRSKDTVDEFNKYFPNDDKILDFVVKLDELKKNGLITQFDFLSNEAVKDKLGLVVLPIRINMKGTEVSINEALKVLTEIEILIRPVDMQITKDTNEPQLWSVQYGGVIYVDEHFGKN